MSSSRSICCQTTAYEASKTEAERAAWQFVAAHPEMKLTTINPGMVFGPAMDEHYGSSLETVEQIVGGRMPLFPNIDMPIVDVRDVARIHVRAMGDDEAVGQRFPANAGAMTLPGMARILREEYPDAGISVRTAPDWLVRTMSVFVALLKTAAKGLGVTTDVVGSDAPAQFGFTYISSRDALIAAAEYIRGAQKVDTGRVRRG